MAINSALAVRAYANAAALTGKTDAAKSQGNPLGDPGAFGDMVKTALSDVTKSGKATEAITADLASGNANLVDLVTAVAETEVAVETLVTVRDRVISAYQEILNMPI